MNKVKKVIRKKLIGEVVSDKMNKTAVVLVRTLQAHRKYHKTVQVRKKYFAHDEKKQFKKGDKVMIVSCRPISSKKHWYCMPITKEKESV